MKRTLNKNIPFFVLALSMLISSVISVFATSEEVYAQGNTVSVGAGSYSREAKGTWSYDSNGQTIEETNKSLLEKLPYEGSQYRHTTDNYTGPLDTSDWATSFLWDLSGTEPYSHSVFAIPFAYKASSEGMMITNPSTIADNNNAAYLMFMPEDGSLTDFVIKPDFATSDAKVDKTTDWTYDIVMENSSNSSQYMKTTMVQGSPFAYFQFKNSNKATIVRKRNGLASTVAYYNGSSISDSNILVLRVYDNADGSIGYEDYDYYAVYAPEGTKFTLNKDGGNIGSIEAVFPAGKSYFTFASLGSTYGIDDDEARALCNMYKLYAYNFVTDTKAEYSYDEKSNVLTTTYSYTVEKKEESTADGTLMGILPHQYKNMEGGDFLAHTYRTIRGTMKIMPGSSFTTKLTYSGFIPNMPDVAESDMAGLQTYVTEYMTNYGNDLLKMGNGSGDTYWTGKALNRVGNVLAAAETCGDTASADKLYKALKTEMEDWLSTDDAETDKYFYYDSGIGSLFGFPQSFNSVDQVNDHHFHYGYYIYAAAQIALRDPSWALDSQYGGMVKEIIGDIACNDRNSTRYPYLRNFSPYEGHSWASGHQAFPDGNNQESSSEALNAWAGIIMFGEATGNKELRDLGIYLYTTEISAVNNYWFDVDKNVLDDRYRYSVSTLDGLDKSTAKVIRNQSSMVWGGKYIYGTWWTAEPLQVQGINLLPMNPASFYLAGDQDYIKENLELALYHEENYTGIDKLADPTDRWNDIWSEYEALADPEYALTYWDRTAEEEGGESRAHTYHYIMSLKNYGTPDTSITSDTVLSTVFNKDGVKTYSAFNVEDTAKTVTFSDGIQIKAEPHKLTTVKSTNIEGVRDYTVEYYKENLNGGYEKEIVTKQGMTGANVTAEKKEIEGFTFDSANSGNKLSDTLTEGKNVTLKLYYKRNQYTLEYELNDGSIAKANPSEYRYGEAFSFNEPTKTGYVFDGWYKDSRYQDRVEGITETTKGNLKLYAKWKDPNEYEVETGKKVISNGTEITFSVSGIDDIGEAVVYFKLYDTKEAAEAITSDTGVGGLPGTNLVDDGSGTWKLTQSLENATGKYMVFRYNVIVNGVGTLSKWGVYEIPSDTSSLVTYRTRHYKEGTDGNYTLADTITSKAEPGTVVTAQARTYAGYSLDESNSNTVKTGTVTADGSFVMKLYYKKNAENDNKEKIAAYTVKHFTQNLSCNGYELADVESKEGTIGQTVTASAKNYTGYTYNNSAEGSRVSGAVTADGKLELSLYYDRNKYKIAYELNGGTNSTQNKSDYVYGVGAALAEPSYEGYTFLGWYTSPDFAEETRVMEISATACDDVTLYAKWMRGDGANPQPNPGTETQPGTTGSGTETQPGTTGSGTETQPGTTDSGTETQPGTTDNQPDENAQKIITIKKKTVTLKPGKTVKNVAIAQGYTGKVSYSTSNPKAATVNAEGKVKAINAGKAVITVTADGEKASFTVRVAPKKITKLKITAKGKTSVKISWKKVNGASGYQVAVKTGKNGKYKVVKTLKGQNKVSYTKTKLKSGKTYYIKVRAYKTIDGKKVYGDYTSVKKYKAK